MPQINNVQIHSFSSEDPNFPAKNLAQSYVTKRWKCEKPGEKSAYVVLKLDQPYKISSIDIGNEFSGVVQILVANSLQNPPNFQELVFATSLMTMIDARNEKNPNRLRMFDKECFIPSVADQKWDLVKFVCTQPFNPRRQYGLSFVNIHTNEEVKPSFDSSLIKPTLSTPKLSTSLSVPKPSSSSKPVKKIGKFAFRTSSSDEESESTSPFAKWKSKKSDAADSQSQSTASDTKAEIKQQLKEKLDSEKKRKRIDLDDSDDEIKRPKKVDRNRAKGLLYESDDDAPNEKLQKKIDKDKEKREKEKHVSKYANLNVSAALSPSTSSKKFSSFIDDPEKTVLSSPSNRIKHYDAEEETKKQTKTTTPGSSSSKSPAKIKQTKEIQFKPFAKLLSGVTFVLSGYQNPERGDIRQKALDMGARYKADWDRDCTHLVCAYSNTPKYNQVKGKGKIISKNWIENCYKEKKRLPWRRFAVDSSARNESESEEEILCESLRPSVSSSGVEVNAHSDSSRDVEDDAGGDSDDDMLVVDKRRDANKQSAPNDRKSGNHSPLKSKAPVIVDSDSDGDMNVVYKTKKDENDNKSEPKKADEGIKEKEHNNSDAAENQMQDDYPDDDSVSSIDITTVECQAFKDKKFYLNEDLSATDKILLADLIKQMLGVVTKNPLKANYIITKSGKSLPRNALVGEVVKDVWVRECFDLQAFIPTLRYKLPSR